MAAQIVHWVLSASGVLLFGWCMFGWLLIPASDDTVTVIFVSQTQKMEHDVRLWLWLKSIGLQSGRLIAVDRLADEADACAAARFCSNKNVEFCSEAELPLLLGLR
ncbi:MAG: hypothetical protein IIV87_03215 [Oscillospiraceae bacterium]|nr:hypothetical protein [Oscillospiraceae bacterium]